MPEQEAGGTLPSSLVAFVVDHPWPVLRMRKSYTEILGSVPAPKRRRRRWKGMLLGTNQMSLSFPRSLYRARHIMSLSLSVLMRKITIEES